MGLPTWHKYYLRTRSGIGVGGEEAVYNYCIYTDLITIMGDHKTSRRHTRYTVVAVSSSSIGRSVVIVGVINLIDPRVSSSES